MSAHIGAFLILLSFQLFLAFTVFADARLNSSQSPALWALLGLQVIQQNAPAFRRGMNASTP